MNKARRKQLDAVKDKIQEAIDELGDILYEENEYYDNIPDNLKQSERANTSESAINTMEDAVSSLDDAISSIEEAQA